MSTTRSRRTHRGSYLFPDPKKPVEFQKYSERRSRKPEITQALLHKIKIRPLGRLLGFPTWLVNDEVIRNTVDCDFTMGSHFAHSAFIPMAEIWVSHLHRPSDMMPLLVHEAVEVYWMTKKRWSYEDAHDRATTMERDIRSKIHRGLIRVPTLSTAMRQGDEIAKRILAGDYLVK